MSRFVAKDHIGELNSIRCELLSNNIGLTAIQFRDALKRIGIPSNTLFWTVLKQAGIVRKVDGEYTFSNHPIHFVMLQNVYNEYYKKRTTYNNKYKEDNKIDKAIKLLKARGFEIIEPIKL